MVVFIKGQLGSYKENTRISIHKKSHRYVQGTNSGCGTNHDLIPFLCYGIGYRKTYFSNLIRIFSYGEAINSIDLKQ